MFHFDFCFEPGLKWEAHTLWAEFEPMFHYDGDVMVMKTVAVLNLYANNVMGIRHVNQATSFPLMKWLTSGH